MKRTLLAVGIAALISMMLVPTGRVFSSGPGSEQSVLPFFLLTHCSCDVLWDAFALQTAFAVVAAAVIVNLFPRKPKT
jgi:hypothetical protein